MQSRRLFTVLAICATPAFAFFLTQVTAWANAGSMPTVFRVAYAFPAGDKLAHFGLLAVMTWLACFSAKRMGWPRSTRSMLAIAIAAIMAADEFAQLGHPARSFDILDLGASWLGVVAGWRIGR